MKKMFRNSLLNLSFLIFACPSLHASPLNDQKKAQMLDNLDVIKHHFEIGYAPAKWKKETYNWDLNKEIEEAKKKVLAKPEITTKEYQKIIRDFFHTFKDFHVSVNFLSTEAATLPFSVKGAEDRYFIDWIDPKKFPVSIYGIRVGDELLKFDGRPVRDVIHEIINDNLPSSNEETDHRIAEIKLTSRSGSMADIVPNGTVAITTQSQKTGKTSTFQLHWNYTPELIENPLDFIEGIDHLSFLFPGMENKQPKIPFDNHMMVADPFHVRLAANNCARSGGLGDKISFLPPLGEIVWSSKDQELEKAEKSKKPSELNAYIYLHPEGYQIGYIRIPHYSLSSDDLKLFGKYVADFEEKTDALVIDQLHNNGGSARTLYSLASMLTDRPLETPYHRIKITQNDVLGCYELMDHIKLLEQQIDNIVPKIPNSFLSGENDKQKSTEENDEDLTFNFQQLLFVKAYCLHIVNEWKKGKTLTSPMPLDEGDVINPHPKYQYTKPILVLIDHMCFSGGDFFPAIMHDNKRALLFGSRTTGAGGFKNIFSFPNIHGIGDFSLTGSIAERKNGEVLENLGVTPDILYQITIDDLRNGYQGYIGEVNKSIHNILNGTPREQPVENPPVELQDLQPQPVVDLSLVSEQVQSLEEIVEPLLVEELVIEKSGNGDAVVEVLQQQVDEINSDVAI